MELTLESIEGNPSQLFFDYIRSDKTRDNYVSYLQIFLDVVPVSVYKTYLNEDPINPGNPQNSEQKFNDQVDQFVKLANTDIKITKQVIHAFVRELKDKVEKKEIKPGTIRNYLKPIKALFAANEIDFSWKLINKSLPRVGKSSDRAYTIEEIQKMMTVAGDIVDKVIILMFSSCGFRVEAWDYFTWSDIVFFYTDKDEVKGMAVRVYAGDAEEYWTHGTPEAAKMLLLYKSAWKSRFGTEPNPSDPLLISTKIIIPTRLRWGGVRTRVIKLLRKSGVRSILPDSKMRHEVPADHGFRKFCNTMMRRAKVDYLDKEEMQGRNALPNESSYGKYVESDFERWDEYQKAIPFLTISDDERDKVALMQKQQENDELEKKNQELEEKQDNIDTLQKQFDEMNIKQVKMEKELFIRKNFNLTSL